MSQFKESASQTAGPYVHIGCVPNFAEITGVYPEDLGGQIAGSDAKGDRITIKGRVIDGSGAILLDALVELWQADANGLYAGAEGADAAVTGFGRIAGDQTNGVFVVDTIKPGSVAPGHAPHITVWIVARGINLGLHTRLYFGDETAANADDPLLKAAGTRAGTMIANRSETGDFIFDIHLQGDAETVFLDI